MAGRPIYISPEERAKMAELYRTHRSLRAVSEALRRDKRVIRRILTEDGIFDAGNYIQGRTALEARALKKEAQRLWRNGMAIDSICEELKIGKRLLRRLVEGIPRPTGRRFMRRPKSTIQTDPIALSWVAGVVDAAGTINIEDTKQRTRPYVRMYTTPEFAATMQKMAGCGMVYHAAERKDRSAVRFIWQLNALVDTLTFIRAIEPYLQSQGRIARHILARYAKELEQIDEEEE